MAKPLVTDDLWAAVGPLLPRKQPKPKGGRPRLPDRAALTGIGFVLTTGTAWEHLPAEMGCGSGMTCWRRLRDWQATGVWGRLHHLLLNRLEAVGRIRWSRAALDSTSVRGKGGEATGPSPTYRGKPGMRRHLVADAEGLPLGLTISGATRHDSKILEATLDAVPGISGADEAGRDGARRSSTPTRHTQVVPSTMLSVVSASSRVWRGRALRTASTSDGTTGSSSVPSRG